LIICEVNKNHLNIRTRELLTAGSQNVNTVEFRFNEAWDGLAKTATFKTSKKTISVLLNTNTTAIPWEALADAGEILAVGVFGVSGETIVLPTVWGILGKVMDAAHLGDEEKEPTPDVYQKILDELNALERPTWDSVQNKPFTTLGGGLAVDENGVLSAEGGGGGSANAVQYVAQSLTDEQKKQARTNIGASPIPTVRYWLDLKADNIINLYNMGVGYGIISPVDYDQTVPTGMSSPMLVIFGRMNYGRVDITVYDGAGAVWSGSLNLSSQTTDVTKTGDYVTNTALTDILHNYVPAENYEENLQEIAQAIGTKLDKNQGAGNAGKILGIGEDGNVIPQDKPTYTLPQATADALGGIKADAATDEDTQDVRIGADGKMRTKPYTLTDADKTAVADAVVADGIAATLVDLPSGGGETWTKILETEVTEATATFEVTNLDNYTEFLVINSGLQNATSTDSVQNLYINGAQVCANFVDVPKSGKTTYNYAIARFNGIVWECHKPNVAASATNLAPSIAYIPYNVVFGVGKATSIKMATANTTYAPVSGKITIYGR
jgi:hypothetical protein